MSDNKVIQPKYAVGDQLLIVGSEISIERVLVVNSIRIDITRRHGDLWQDIFYGFEQSKWMHNETEIIKKVLK